MEQMGSLCLTRRVGESLHIGANVVYFRRVTAEFATVTVKREDGTFYDSTITSTRDLHLGNVVLSKALSRTRNQCKVVIKAPKDVLILRGELVKK